MSGRYLYCQNTSCGVYLGSLGGDDCWICGWSAGRYMGEDEEPEADDDYAALYAQAVLHAEAKALRAENGRLQADRDRANQYANQQALECNKLSTELEAARGERQEAVAWALANSADEIGRFAPIYYTKEGAISWANGRNIFPLYTTPQPGQDVRALLSADDVRDACANAVSVFAEEANADQCLEAVEYMREVLLAQIARRQARP